MEEAVPALQATLTVLYHIHATFRGAEITATLDTRLHTTLNYTGPDDGHDNDDDGGGGGGARRQRLSQQRRRQRQPARNERPGSGSNSF